MIRANIKKPLENFEKEEITIGSFEEFRINTFFSRRIYLKLIEGKAEIFGCEMTYNYYLIPTDLKSISVFSPTGCRLDIFVEPEVKKDIRFYTNFDEDGYFNQLFALNSILESHRHHSFANFQAGPKTLVIGSENAGKFTLIRTLSNYAVKNEWKPILADLDPIESKLTTFGSISAAILTEFVPYNFNEISKIAYFFGYDSLSTRFDFYSKQIRILENQIQVKIQNQIEQFKMWLASGSFLEIEDQKKYFESFKNSMREIFKIDSSTELNPKVLAKLLSEQIGVIGNDTATELNAKLLTKLLSESLEVFIQQLPRNLLNEYLDKEIFASGVFYNLPNEISSLKQSEIKEIIEILAPDYLVIIDNDYLKKQVEELCREKRIKLLRFPKNSGVSAIDSLERKELRANQIQDYFNSEQLMCIRDVILTTDVTIYQIESESNLILKYISPVSDKNLVLTKVELSLTSVKGKFLSLINLPVSDKIKIEDIMGAELISLIYVIDSNEKTISLTRPQGIIENYNKYVMCVGNIGIQ